MAGGERLHPLLGRPGKTPVRAGGATGRIGSFGLTRVGLGGIPKQHNGVDLLTVARWPVFAAHTGTVELAGWENPEDHAQGYGQRVRLVGMHAGVRTVYGHLEVVLVAPGESVAAGSAVGLAGRTGNLSDDVPTHLHFEVHAAGAGGVWTPTDPEAWLTVIPTAPPAPPAETA